MLHDHVQRVSHALQLCVSVRSGCTGPRSPQGLLRCLVCLAIGPYCCRTLCTVTKSNVFRRRWCCRGCQIWLHGRQRQPSMTDWNARSAHPYGSTPGHSYGTRKSLLFPAVTPLGSVLTLLFRSYAGTLGYNTGTHAGRSGLIGSRMQLSMSRHTRVLAHTDGACAPAASYRSSTPPLRPGSCGAFLSTPYPSLSPGAPCGPRTPHLRPQPIPQPHTPYLDTTRHMCTHAAANRLGHAPPQATAYPDMQIQQLTPAVRHLQCPQPLTPAGQLTEAPAPPAETSCPDSPGQLHR